MKLKIYLLNNDFFSKNKTLLLKNEDDDERGVVQVLSQCLFFLRIRTLRYGSVLFFFIFFHFHQ
jgi:hypothetical protein